MKNQAISEFPVLGDSNESMRVIASEAKQSRGAKEDQSADPDCFASLAMTWGSDVHGRTGLTLPTTATEQQS
jgi:hypothetical protein